MYLGHPLAKGLGQCLRCPPLYGRDGGGGGGGGGGDDDDDDIYRCNQ
jgi:hypothetical protein